MQDDLRGLRQPYRGRALDFPARIGFLAQPEVGHAGRSRRRVVDRRGGFARWFVPIQAMDVGRSTRTRQGAGHLRTPSRARFAGTLIALAVAGAGHATAARAADDATQPSYSDSVFSADRWGLSVGGFAGFAPAYEGSDEFDLVGYPLIVPRYYGPGYDPNAPARVTFRGLDDVRVTALRLGGLDLGPVVGYNLGRDENLSARLGGLGDVDGGFTAGAFAAYRLEPFFVDVALNKQITGDDTGYTIRFGGGVEQRVSERLTASAYLNSSYASDDYMDAYFSISPAQAGLSTAGLGIYDAGAGFKDVGIDLGLDYRVTDRVTLRTRAGYSRLLQDAAASPVVTSRDQFSGGLGMTYTFGRTE